MSARLIPQALVLDSPINPSPAFLRTVLAGVFNRDVKTSADPIDNLSESETVVVLGSKLLLDLGFERNHIQAIFRKFKDVIECWGAQLRSAIASQGGDKPLKLRPRTLMLTISDNTRAAMVNNHEVHTQYYDFKKDEELTALTGVAPILQLAVNLSQLFESVVDTHRSDWYRLAVKEAAESVCQGERAVD
jgi:hypothetical protein